MNPTIRVTARVSPASWAVALTLVAVACSGSQADALGSASGIFGGAGGIPDAVVLAGQTSSAGSGGSAPLPNSCANTPQGTLALIDDFDDGNSLAAYEPNREAYWFIVHDDTAGTITPAGDFVPEAGGLHGSQVAHITAEGYSSWGAVFTVNISHKEALRCPYDASAFDGLRFAARGHGSVRVQVEMPAVIDKEYGGTCDPARGQICYDAHGTYVTLSDEYRVFELPWSELQQRNFGTRVQFEPKTILAIQFQLEPFQLPIDFWLDDVAFWDGLHSEPSAGGAGAGGDGGAGPGGMVGASAGQGGM